MATQDLPVTSFALLGLLSLGDGLTGYELKQRADRTMRFYWTAPAMSQVYSELARLAREGLVRKEGHGRGSTYRLTPTGRTAVQQWTRHTSPEFPVFKHPPALQLMHGHLSTPQALMGMLESYLEQVESAHADLCEVRRSLEGRDAPGEPFHYPSIVAEWGLDHFESEKAIATRTIEKLRAAAAETGATGGEE